MKYTKASMFVWLALNAVFQMHAFHSTIGDQRKKEEKENRRKEAVKQITFFRISQKKTQPIDSIEKDQLADLKILIAQKKFHDAHQFLKRLIPVKQFFHIGYLLSEVQFDYIVSKKDNTYVPSRMSGNFIIKNRNTRAFFNYIKNQKIEWSDNLPLLEKAFESVFVKPKYRFTVKRLLRSINNNSRNCRINA